VRFEPAGLTNDADIRTAKSIVDYIFRWMGKKFLTAEQQEELGSLSPQVRASTRSGRYASISLRMRCAATSRSQSCLRADVPEYRQKDVLRSLASSGCHGKYADLCLRRPKACTTAVKALAKMVPAASR
jgi:hypothetical protein